MKKTYTFKHKLLLVLVAITTLSACDNKSSDNLVEKSQPLRPVRTMILETADTTPVHEFTAVVDASLKADLSFKVSGELIEILVKEGDQVTKGDILAKLNDTDITIELTNAQSNFDKAKSDFDRAKKLIKTDYISKSDFEQLRATYNSAKAQLDIATNNLRYTQLIASFDGTIAKVYPEKFQEVNAKANIIRLHNLSKVKILIDVPQSFIIRMNKDSDKGEISAKFSAIPNQVFPLQFSEVVTLADEQTKTYQVVFTMNASKGHSILPGMTATVMAKINLPANHDPAFYLPANVVLKDNNNHYVFVVNQVEEGKGKVTKKVVTIGEITPLGIEVYSGLTQGDVVITAGMTKVSDGMLVKL